MNSSPLIHVEDLCRHYKVGTEVVRALDGVSLDVGRGEFLGIAGASGSGKSTLLYLLGGLDRPTSGEIWVDGQNIAEMDEDGLSGFRQTQIGFVFQMFNLLPSMTALENVEFPMLFSAVPPDERRERAVRLMELVGLKGRMGHRPTELSGGQQQRVAIARSLVNNPSIILTDEPTGNLDSRSGEDVLALLKELNGQGRTLVIVSHDPAIIAQASRAIRLKDGVIIEN